MRIAYNKDGLPYILDEKDTVWEFNQTNAGDMIAELSTNGALLEEVRESVNQYIENKINEYNQSEKNTFEKLGKSVNIFSQFGLVLSIVSICDQAEDLYYQTINPKDHENWIWSKTERVWNPPIPIPYGEYGEYYIWNDESSFWDIAVPSPGPGYVWSDQSHSWQPVVSYPIDAEPDEFIWSDITNAWVLNENRNS